jgi:Fic family protein
MPVVSATEKPDLFRFITDTNLVRQYDFLKASVMIALEHPEQPIGHEVVRQLNYHAVVNLCETPGLYRKCPVFINNTAHKPPPHADVEKLMDACLIYLGDHWKVKSATHLAAYALWRLNWIHPFVEGNGRSARATCHLIMCAKHGMWLPGSKTIPMQIRENRTPYYEALRAADEAYENGGKIDLSKLEVYLDELLTKQLS